MAQHIYLETGSGSDVLNYRGVAGKGSDSKSFKRIMEAKGSKVIISDDFLGLKINGSSERIV